VHRNFTATWSVAAKAKKFLKYVSKGNCSVKVHLWGRVSDTLQLLKKKNMDLYVLRWKYLQYVLVGDK
jgi:hypothetical protein